MPLIILLILFVGLPVLELYVLIEVGSGLGGWQTVGLVLLTAFVGLALVRMQGLSVVNRAQEALAANQAPVRELVDGLFLVVAGVMLVVPGFITDAFGFLLLIPPVRRAIGMLVFLAVSRSPHVRTWSAGRGPSADRPETIDGEFEDVSSPEPKPRDPPPKLTDRKCGPSDR